MIIGIDLDGVVFNSDMAFRAYGELFDLKIGGKGIVNPQGSNVQKKYCWEDKYANMYLDECLLPIEREAAFMPYVKDVINLLQKDGNKLVVITNRGLLHKEEITITKKRLKDGGIKFDKVCFSTADKLKTCLKEGVELMIEDNTDYAENIMKAGIQVFHFRCGGSNKIDNDKIIEVHNWGEVYRQYLLFKEGAADKGEEKDKTL